MVIDVSTKFSSLIFEMPISLVNRNMSMNLPNGYKHTMFYISQL